MKPFSKKEFAAAVSILTFCLMVADFLRRDVKPWWASEELITD